MRRVAEMLLGWLLLAIAYAVASLLVADPVLLPNLGAVLLATSQLFGGGGGWGMSRPRWVKPALQSCSR
jgi:hypothetical protein